MINAERIADKIVGMIADGRLTYSLIESVGFWIAHYSTDSETESKLLTFAHSIIDNVKETKERNATSKWKDLYGN